MVIEGTSLGFNDSLGKALGPIDGALLDLAFWALALVDLALLGLGYLL